MKEERTVVQEVQYAARGLFPSPLVEGGRCEGSRGEEGAATQVMNAIKVLRFSALCLPPSALRALAASA